MKNRVERMPKEPIDTWKKYALAIKNKQLLDAIRARSSGTA
jgi:hypothetical protein